MQFAAVASSAAFRSQPKKRHRAKSRMHNFLLGLTSIIVLGVVAQWSAWRLHTFDSVAARLRVNCRASDRLSSSRRTAGTTAAAGRFAICRRHSFRRGIVAQAARAAHRGRGAAAIGHARSGRYRRHYGRRRSLLARLALAASGSARSDSCGHRPDGDWSAAAAFAIGGTGWFDSQMGRDRDRSGRRNASSTDFRRGSRRRRERSGRRACEGLF